MPMNPLAIRTMAGLEDASLLDHINRLEAIDSGQTGSAGISPGEVALLGILYYRLDLITQPPTTNHQDIPHETNPS